MNLSEIEERVLRAVVTKGRIEADLQSRKGKLTEERRSLKRMEKALEIVREVALATQGQLEAGISKIASLALETVFDDPYELRMEFQVKRGKTEARLYFMRDGLEFDPVQSSGGGVLDVAGFALRIAYWALRGAKRTRPVFLLDEPFKHLSVDLMERAGIMVRELSREVGAQMIIVSHSEELIESADRVFYVSKPGEVSKVTFEDYHKS